MNQPLRPATMWSRSSCGTICRRIGDLKSKLGPRRQWQVLSKGNPLPNEGSTAFPLLLLLRATKTLVTDSFMEMPVPPYGKTAA
jgi:hypothetical protein